jgi:coatomer subunit beta'
MLHGCYTFAIMQGLIDEHRACKYVVQEAGTVDLYSTPEGIHGGALLGVRGTEHIAFHDWASLRCVRRIDVATEAVYWNTAGDMLALATATSFYILRCAL